MKKIILIIVFTVSLNVFSQDFGFVKNRSLHQKINNLLTFINESPTIRDNYGNEKIYIASNGNAVMTVVIITNVGRIDEENRCIKINERVTWIIDDINDVDNKYIDKEKLKKISDCSCILKKEKSKEMLNSLFDYHLDINGNYLLDLLVTFDRLLYLDIEFREDLSNDD